MKNRFRLARAIAVAASAMLAVAGCSLDASSNGAAEATATSGQTEGDESSSDSEKSSSPDPTTSESASSQPSESSDADSNVSIPEGYKQVTAPNVNLSFAIPDEWVNALDDPELRKAVAEANNMTEDELVKTFDAFYESTTFENDFIDNINVNANAIGEEIPDEALLKRALTDISDYRTVETAAGKVAVINVEDSSGIQCIGVFAPAEDGQYHGIFINTKSKEQTQALADVVLSTIH
ncbi:MAG: hypothetical protein Q3979_04025 [Actinomycetaceae bacterium]|nr:hypothetical protein [Actinomycetaceae bacterium]